MDFTVFDDVKLMRIVTPQRTAFKRGGKERRTDYRWIFIKLREIYKEIKRDNCLQIYSFYESAIIQEHLRMCIGN